MTTTTFQNPIGPRTAASPDPWLICHEGVYYLTYTGGDRISITKASSLGELSGTAPTEVWRDDTPTRCSMIWAPELHLLDGPNGRRWYLYYTASDREKIDDHHRMHVLESAGDDPMGPYSYKGQLATDPENRFYAIDGTVLRKPDGSLYFLWAGRPDHVLFIAPMSDPWTVSGERIHLPASGFGCDEVREGPVCLYRNDRIFLIYSACDTGKPDYKLGMLIADENCDVTDPASWRQFPEPVFTRFDAHGVYGPGHNSFFVSPDGAEDWICYHAKTTSEYTYQNRTARAQRFTWNADSTPNFGVPLSLEQEIPEPSGTAAA